MTTKINRVLFDYDGTLIVHDKGNEGRQIANILGLDEEKVPEFSERLKVFFETSCGRRYYKNEKMTYDLYYSILNNMMRPKDFGVTVEQLQQAINEKSKYSCKIEPTAKETLDYLLDKGYQLCIFTNGFFDAQVDNMKYNGFYDYFERIYAWDGYYAKPDRRALLRALAGTDPKNNMMIGDSITNDIAPGKAIGICTVGINMSDHHKKGIIPDYEITTLSELKKLL